MKILVRTYGSHLMGMGHLYRMQKLLNKLQEKFAIEVALLTRDFEESRSLFNGIYSNEIIRVSPSISENEEIEYLKSFYSDCYDICINDQLNTSENIAKELIRISKKSVSFDDNGEGNIYFDILINVLYPSDNNLSNEYNDFKYLILDDFSREKELYILKQEVKKIFINQGAADTWGAIPDLLKDLHNLDLDLELKVLLGPSFKHFNELCKVLKNMRKKVEIINFSNNVIDLVKDCDLAIVGGGNTLFEIASLGIPIIAVTREEKELITISRLLKYNLIYGNESLYDSNIQYLIEDVIVDTNGRKEKYLLTRITFNYEGLNNISNLLLKGKK